MSPISLNDVLGDWNAYLLSYILVEDGVVIPKGIAIETPVLNGDASSAKINGHSANGYRPTSVNGSANGRIPSTLQPMRQASPTKRKRDPSPNGFHDSPRLAKRDMLTNGHTPRYNKPLPPPPSDEPPPLPSDPPQESEAENNKENGVPEDESDRPFTWQPKQPKSKDKQSWMKVNNAAFGSGFGLGRNNYNPPNRGRNSSAGSNGSKHHGHGGKKVRGPPTPYAAQGFGKRRF